MHGNYEEGKSDSERKDIFASRAPTGAAPGAGYQQAEWCALLPLEEGDARSDVALFGATQDVYCQAAEGEARHRQDFARSPYCRRLCESCVVPICTECRQRLASYEKVRLCSTVPMAIANDRYYGYVFDALAKGEVTWFECAAASLVWTTIVVFYLEEP